MKTPPDLITGVITEIGILHPAAAFSVLQQMQPSQKLSQLAAGLVERGALVRRRSGSVTGGSDG